MIKFIPLYFVVVSVFLFAFFFSSYTARPIAFNTPPPFYAGGLEKNSGGQPEQVAYASLFAPSQASTAPNKLLATSSFSSPQQCASCHASIHGNWQDSLHAFSAQDPLYVKVKDAFAGDMGEPAVRFCAGCHAPVALAAGEVGLYSRESPSSLQGVSCGVCHSMERVDGGNARYVLNPGRWHSPRVGDALGFGVSLGDRLAGWVLNANPKVHRSDMLTPAVRDGTVCQACHNLEVAGVKVQSTWDEWKASPYAARGVSCQGCHFNESGDPKDRVPGRVAAGGQPRGHVYQHFLGGGSGLVWGLLQRDVRSVRVVKNREGLRRAVKLEATRAARGVLVAVTNVGAGHDVPTGVNDLRELWLEVTGFDAAGAVVFKRGHLDPAGKFEANTTVFRSVLVDARGNPLERHDIWRAKGVLSDTRLKALERREVRYGLPARAKRVVVRLLWRDVPANFAQWVLGVSGAQVQVLELAKVVL